MKTTTRLVCTLLCGATLLASCDDTPTDQPQPTVRSSYEQLQAKLLTTTCAASGCHVTGSAMAAESGLILEPSVAYANLVGVEPKNAAAKARGLLRVKPGSPDSSFLYIKVTDPSHHSGYGAQMPLGSDALSKGQMDFIKAWIAAGAPKTGTVADSTLLDDHSHHTIQFVPLTPPAPGTGFQITTGLFDIAPHFERELFLLRGLGNTEAVYVNKIETTMRSGSHHLVLYTYMPQTPASLIPPKDVIFDIRRPDGSIDQDAFKSQSYRLFFAGAMTPHEKYEMPPGVALRLQPNQVVDMNSHYVNTTGLVRAGEAMANLYTVDSASVQKVAQTLFLNHDEFVLPPGQRTTITKTFRMPRKRSIFLLNSHMHKRGETFVIKIAGGTRDGEVVYTSTSWNHPPVVQFNDHPIVLNAGEGLTSEVTYYNETSQPIEFGLLSDDEMDIIYAYYYE